jgi:fused signal recognition particle receptor
MSIFNKLKERLFKTREQIFGRVAQLLRGTSVLNEQTLNSIEEILITADIGVKTAQTIMANLKLRIKKEKIEHPNQLTHLLREEIEKLIIPSATTRIEDRLQNHKPFVILIVGVNGTGKTTTVGKLAHRLASQKYKVLLAAGDTFRAAASGQLEIWAKRSHVDIVRQTEGADSASVIFDALASAKARHYDIVLIDTAGRLHNKVNLMEELKKIDRVIKKQIPDAPHDTLLVLDGTTGQNAIEQARQFSKAVPVTGLVMTKLDGTAKGGVVLAIQREIKIPVQYIGVGESIDDLVDFNIHDFVSAIVE